MRSHRKASAVIAAIVLAMILLTVLTSVSGGNGGALTDSTSCTQWASSSASQQNAYAQLFLNEHGALPNGEGTVTTVRSDINSECVHAAYLGESDDVTVVAAVNHAF